VRGKDLHNLFRHGTGGYDSIEGADAAGGEYDARTPAGNDIGMDVREVEPVDVDLEIGTASAEDVEAEAIPVFLFHKGSLEGAHGEKRSFRVDADGSGSSDGLRALDGTRLGSINRSGLLSLGKARGERAIERTEQIMRCFISSPF